MTKRSLRTPLYELITARRDRGEPSEEAAPAPAAPGPSWLAAGRTVRLPVGYLLLGGAAAVLLLACAYMFGHWRGAEDQRARFDQAILGAGAGDGTRHVRDPLQEGENRTGAAEPGGAMARPEETVSPPRGGPSAAGAGDAAWGPMESDPRRPGLHYMVLIATRTEGARRLAAFCRARGLETYVVGGNNERLRRVIVLPGVPTQSRSDPQVQRLMDRVDPVCRAWKDENPREGDLHDRYLEPYQP